jgi:hypothetical protein
LMIGYGVIFVLHQQLHRHFVVDVHCRRLCKWPNTLWVWSAQVVAAASGWAVELEEARARWLASPRRCYASFWWLIVARGAAATGAGNGESGGGGRRDGMDRWFVSVKRAWGICLVKSDVVQDVGTPNRLLEPRDRCGSAAYFIWLQNTSASFGSLRCELNFAPTPKLAIGRRRRAPCRCS